ncbi:MAG: oligosaccharide flippase family protein [Candidatus Komeilibacteria bacterium]
MTRLQQQAYRLLRWSERHTKTDMIYLARGGFWLLAGQVGGALLSLGVAVVLAHALSRETYGDYKYILSVLSLLTITSLQGLSPAITRSVAQGNEGGLTQALVLRIKWGLLGLGIGILGAIYSYWQHNQTLTLTYAVIALAAPLFDSLKIYDAFLRGKKLFQPSSILQFISKAITSAALVLTVLISKNLTIIIASYCLIFIICELLIYRYVKNKYVQNSYTDPATASYGKHLSLNALVGTAAAYLDKLLVYYLLGPVPLAVYSYAIAIPEQLKAGQKALDLLIFPKFAANQADEIQAGIVGKFWRLFLLYATLAAAYIIAAPWLFQWLFPQYNDAVIYSQLFALSIVGAAINPAFTYLQAKKKIKAQYLNNTLTAVFQIAIMIVMIIQWGLLGLIIARIITRFVSAGLNLFFYHYSKSSLD